MDFKRVNVNKTGPSRAELVSGTIKNVLNNSANPLSKFMENTQPMLTKWYHQNKKYSLYGKGYQDTAGPYDGGIKYTLIRGYVAYGYTEERAVDVEEGDNLRIRMKPQNLTMMHIPGSLIPYVNDRVSLEIEDHRYLYKVIDSRPVTWNNKPYYRTELSKCDIKSEGYYEEDFVHDGLIVDILDYNEDNVGTKDSPFLNAGSVDDLNTLNKLKEDLMFKYNDFFYKEYQNTYMAIDPDHAGLLSYTPLLVDLQMEYRPLWVYGVNAILTHETIVNKMSKYNYQDHLIRDFLNKEEGAWDELKEKGLDFSTYTYTSDITSPLYKIQSFLNDGEWYTIYDYFYGVDRYYNEDGTSIDVVNKTNIKVPEKLHEMFELYSKGELNADYLKTFLKKYRVELDFPHMLWTMVILVMIDSITKSINAGTK